MCLITYIIIYLLASAVKNIIKDHRKKSMFLIKISLTCPIKCKLTETFDLESI